jgi:sterol desaturase/sphingolipid hydroxylase (fatty acid hydroxylase superfamily)
MPINGFLYYGDFFAIPAAIIVLACFAFAGAGLGAAPGLSIALLIGLAAWTLVEYVIHRFVYHRAPLLSHLHGAHHRAPREFIGAPSFLSSGFLIAVCFLPVFVFDAAAASGFTIGMLLGYAAYMFVHHAMHHLTIAPGHWLYQARVRHLAHHHHDNANFGIVTGFWDRAFGTAGVPRGRVRHHDADAGAHVSLED